MFIEVVVLCMQLVGITVNPVCKIAENAFGKYVCAIGMHVTTRVSLLANVQ
jgi:hypothetical protein